MTLPLRLSERKSADISAGFFFSSISFRRPCDVVCFLLLFSRSLLSLSSLCPSPSRRWQSTLARAVPNQDRTVPDRSAPSVSLFQSFSSPLELTASEKRSELFLVKRSLRFHSYRFTRSRRDWQSLLICEREWKDCQRLRRIGFARFARRVWTWQGRWTDPSTGLRTTRLVPRRTARPRDLVFGGVKGAPVSGSARPRSHDQRSDRITPTRGGHVGIK